MCDRPRQPHPHGPRRQYLGLGQRFATEKLSATSLDVVREYALAMQALSNSKFAEARPTSRGGQARPELRPGLRRHGDRPANMGQPQEAERYVKEAIRHVDRMTERERFRTRGMFYYITNDYEACVKEYGDLLVSTRPTSPRATTSRSVLDQAAQHGPAREEMQRVVAILPKRSLYRVNAALYSAYAGDFAAAEQRGPGRPGTAGSLGAAGAGAGQAGTGRASARPRRDLRGAGHGRVPGRRTRPRAWPTSPSTRAVSPMPRDSSPTARRPTWRPRKPTARPISSPGWPTPNWPAAAAREARAAADRAVAHSTAIQVRFLAGRIYAEAGRCAKASAIAIELGARAAGRVAGVRQDARGGSCCWSGVPRQAVAR